MRVEADSFVCVCECACACACACIIIIIIYYIIYNMMVVVK